VSHSSQVAHHFEDIEQQNESLVLGMWLFLATEVMFFGGLFTAYVVYRTTYSEVFHEASRTLDLTLGTVNTLVLLVSSLTMAMGVYAAKTGRKNLLPLMLVATIILGLAFLGVKAVEYGQKFEHHLVPGAGFVWPGDNPPHAQLFFVLYFIMTGMHAFHMVIGIVMMAMLLVMAMLGKFGPERYMGVEMAGLYWHFVDIVWVFLFPLLYLIDRS